MEDNVTKTTFDLETVNNMGQTPLLCAVGTDDIAEKVQYLLDRGANVNKRDADRFGNIINIAAASSRDLEFKMIARMPSERVTSWTLETRSHRQG